MRNRLECKDICGWYFFCKMHSHYPYIGPNIKNCGAGRNKFHKMEEIVFLAVPFQRIYFKYSKCEKIIVKSEEFMEKSFCQVLHWNLYRIEKNIFSYSAPLGPYLQ